MYRNLGVIFILSLFNFLVNLQAQDCDNGETSIVVEVVNDRYPGEISWYLYYENGDTIHSIDYETADTMYDVSIYSLEDEAYYYEDTLAYDDLEDLSVLRDTFCVIADSCLVFSIVDRSGDGICCEHKDGSYSIYSEDTLVAQGGLFTYNEINNINCGEGKNCNQAPNTELDIPYTTTYDDHWYVFTPDSSGRYLINTCDNNTCNTSIWVYDHCFGANTTDGIVGAIAYTTEGCDSTTQQASLEVNLEGGNVFYIRIGDNEDDCQNINWNLTYIGAPVGCTDPTACNYDAFATELEEGSCLYPGDPNCPAGPDLEVVQYVIKNSLRLEILEETDSQLEEQSCLIEERCVNGYGARELLRFTTTISNIGDLDYYIGQPPEDEDSLDPNWEFDPCHDHWHYEGYAEYLLFNDANEELPIGFKNGFCVLDLSCFEGGTAKYTCGLQGISSQCYDTYESDLACQWLDITGVAAGLYTLVVRVNWDKSPDATGRVETNYTNNWAQVCFQLSRDATGHPSILVIPEQYCDPYVDCEGTEHGSAMIDCSGVCGGESIKGDYDGNLTIDSLDLEDYLTAIIINDAATNCTDLNKDGILSITDASLINECLIEGIETNITNGKCTFPYGITNIYDTVTFTIDTIHWEERYVDFNIKNPNNTILGFQLGIEGVKIDSIEMLIENIEDYNIRTDHNFSVLYGLAEDGEPLPKMTEESPFLRIYFGEEAVADSLCFNCFHTVVNGQREETIINAADECHYLPPHIDCAEVIGGSLVLDCNNECGGTGIFGDFNEDALTDGEDVEDYLTSLLFQNSTTISCNDLNGDGENTLADIVLLDICVQDDDCKETMTPIGLADTVTWSIGTLNDTAAYFELSLQNPNAQVRAFQLEFSGFRISGIEPINPSSLDYSFLYNDTMLVALISDGAIEEQGATLPVFKIFIDEDTAAHEILCLEQVIEVIGDNGRFLHPEIINPCLDVSAFLDCAEIFNGQLKLDCSGICGGDALFGDFNQDAVINATDLDGYLAFLLAQDMENNTCQDLNNDGVVGLTDATLLEICIRDDFSPLSCNFPIETYNEMDTTFWHIGGLNVEQRYFDVILENPISYIQGFHLRFGGIIIDSVEALPIDSTQMDIELVNNENTLIGLLLSKTAIDMESVAYPLLRIHFNEIVEGTEICLSEVLDVVNEEGAKILSVLSDGCINIEAYKDCAGIFNGTETLDCNGICGGNSIQGDINGDTALNQLDVDAYVTTLLSTNATTFPCYDFNNDNTITLSDALFLNTCIEQDTLCNGAVTILNETEMASFVIEGLNATEQSFNIRILNTECNVLGAHLKLQGITISEIIPAPDLLEDFNISISYVNKELALWTNNIGGILQNEEGYILGKVYFDAIDAEDICIEEVVSVVNEQYQKINGMIDGDCINLAPYYDCAGIFNGGTAIDCNGICGGTTLQGDFNNDQVIDAQDISDYIQALFTDNTTITPCEDWNNDNTLSLMDIVLVDACLANEEMCNTLDNGYNENELALFVIENLNVEEQYFTLKIENSTSDLIGFHLRFSGMQIKEVITENGAAFSLNHAIAANETEIISWAKDGTNIPQSQTEFTVLRIHFEAENTTEICLEAVEEAVNTQYERINAVANASCIDISAHLDCAGLFNGGSVTDCNGQCGGDALSGDYNLDATTGISDVYAYVYDIVQESWNATICNDLNTDGKITVCDPILLNACILDVESATCTFPVQTEVSNDILVLSIDQTNTEEQFFDVYIQNPDSEVLGFQFEIEGVEIEQVEVLDPAFGNLDLFISHNEELVVGLMADVKGLEPQADPLLFVRIHYSEILGSNTACLKNPVFIDENRKESIIQLGVACTADLGTALRIPTEEVAVKVYPNPFLEEAFIYFSNPTNEIFTLKLINVQGELIREVSGITGTTYELKREDLPTGMYFFELEGSYQYTGKIIVR